MSQRRLIGTCPVCDGAFRVTQLTCEACGARLEGDFPLDRFARLTREQLEFVEVFVAHRGNIREVERVLGISYPTVRARLDGVIEALGHKAERRTRSQVDRKAVLESLSRGEISADEALKRIRGEA